VHHKLEQASPYYCVSSVVLKSHSQVS